MNVNEATISKAVSIFRNSSKLADVELCRALVHVGFECFLAARLVEFLPSVYCRLMLKDSGCLFSDDYERKVADGRNEKRSLLSDPIWNALMEFAQRESAQVSKQDILVIAARSAEFNAANQLLNRGSKLENLRFTPILLPWPESGPEL